MTSPDGGKYVGEFKDNNRTGQGSFTFPDGSRYAGEWRDGKYHGQGTVTLPDGSVLRAGIWENGNFVRGR